VPESKERFKTKDVFEIQLLFAYCFTGLCAHQQATGSSRHIESSGVPAANDRLPSGPANRCGCGETSV